MRRLPARQRPQAPWRCRRPKPTVPLLVPPRRVITRQARVLAQINAAGAGVAGTVPERSLCRTRLRQVASCSGAVVSSGTPRSSVLDGVGHQGLGDAICWPLAAGVD